MTAAQARARVEELTSRQLLDALRILYPDRLPAALPIDAFDVARQVGQQEVLRLLDAAIRSAENKSGRDRLRLVNPD